MATQKTLKSDRHPNYTIKYFQTGTIEQWSMEHDDYSGYRIAVYPEMKCDNGEAVAELLTQNKTVHGEYDWTSANNRCEGRLSKVKAELERRGAYWAKQ